VENTQISLQLAVELVEARVAGHLFQCKIPGAKKPVWICGGDGGRLTLRRVAEEVSV